MEQVQLWGERRTATVILADVQRSTDLMERMGSEAWVSMMNRVFHVLESEIYRYGGIVDQFRGDGLVASFGTVAAHADDPERAILASLAMQAAASRYADELNEEEGVELKLRVGVNTGEVIVANIGDRTRHSEDTAMGEAIALAARMEQAAQPGTVLVSENTYRQVESQFDWESLGEIEVKGISRPTKVYRPLRPRELALRSLRLETLGLSPVLIGRERELATILDRIQRLREGRGHIVFLTGDEGTGKSYLVSEVRQQVLRDDALLVQAGGANQSSGRVTWLRGQCRSYEQSWPYSMWIDLLERWLDAKDASRQEAARRLQADCERLWATAKAEHYPFLAMLLSLPLEGELAQQIAELDAEYLRQQTFRAVRAWVEAVARGGPLVLTFDDVYWADGTSLQLLEYCLPLCDHLSVLFLIAFRTRLKSAVWEFRQRVEQQYPHRITGLLLDRLSPTESAQMVDALVGVGTMPDRVKGQLVAKAEGNPYYVEEIIRSLIRECTLIQEGERDWCLADDVEKLGLPDTLRGLLSAQIDDLAPAERHVLQVAALIGNVFWTNVLEELVGTEVDLPACLTGLQRAQLVRERGKVSDLGMEYDFRSPLLREVAHDTLLTRQRTTYAASAADYMAGLFGGEVLTRYYDVVAHLYRTAGQHRRELFYTLSAAEHAQSVYANGEALALYRRALELIDELAGESEDKSAGAWLAWRMESLIGVGRILLGTGQADQAEPCLRQAVEVAERSGVGAREQARLYYWLCEALFWLGRYQEQVETATRGLALVAREGPSVEVALMNQEIAVGSLQLGRPDTYREYTERTAQFLQSLPYSEELRPAYDHVASMYAWHRRQPDEAMRWLDALRARAIEHRDLRALAQSHDHAGLVLMMTGDLAGAIGEYHQALELCERVGDRLQQMDAISHLADGFLALGELEDAREHAEHLLEVAFQVDNPESLAWAYWRVGRVAHAEGEWNEALSSFQKADTSLQSSSALSQRAMTMYCLAATHLHKGERTVAVRTLEDSLAVAGPQAMAENPLFLALVLTAIESASRDTATFEALCNRWQERIPPTALGQWSLDPVEAPVADWPPLEEGAYGIQPQGPWAWADPLGGSTCHTNGGWWIEAANGRDLWDGNVSAPRLLRRVSGECAWEATCAVGTRGRPSIGGLVLWRSGEDFVSLVWGFGGPGGLVFRGYVDGESRIAGRGWLPSATDQVQLRMECRAGRVRAACSPDGNQWYRVGETEWDAALPAQIGALAIGEIDRLVYPAAFPQGTEIVFRDVRVWTAEPAAEDAIGD